MKRSPLLLIVLLCIMVNPPVYSAEVFSFISKPANNSVNNEAVSLKVTANVVTGATRYTIELNTHADFSGPSIVQTSPIDNQRTLAFTNLGYNTRYYARATTNASSGYGKVTSFVTRAETFTMLVEPANTIASLDPIAIRVKAALLNYASSYTIEISTSAAFDNVSMTLSGTNPHFLVRTFNYATTYYARVKANINTTYGPTTSFSTRAKSSKLRLWGITSSGGVDDRGVIYSYSVDSLKFTKNFDYTLQDEYDEENFTGTLMPAPYSGFYVLTQSVRSSAATGGIYLFKNSGLQEVAGVGQRNGSAILASDDNFYVTQGQYISAERIVNASSLGIIHKFGPIANGREIYECKLTEYTDGYLYGMANKGGLYNAGVIYRMKKDGSSYAVIHHFNSSVDGHVRAGGVTDGKDGYLYGAAAYGGINNSGTLFRLRPDGSEFSILHQFEEAFGSEVWSPVTIKDGVIYGTTMFGGTGGEGTIYRLNKDGSGFVVMHNFYSDWDSGMEPMEPLVPDDFGNLYGVTPRGGINGWGTLFKIKTDGSGFMKLHDFSIENGRNPGGIILTDDTFGSSPSSARMAFTKPTENVNVKFYPNPFSDHINIQSQTNLTDLAIADVNGHVLYQEKNIKSGSLNLGKDLAPGIYILKAKDGNKTVTQRLVKN
jgi:uncharacterized repeat protein (TIGR03803 family)